MKSMTAYGQKVITTATSSFSRQLRIECSSVNRKFLDVDIRLPRGWELLDMDLRKLISSKITRGKIALTIQEIGFEGAAQSVKANIALAKTVFQELSAIQTALGLKNIDEQLFRSVLSFPHVLEDLSTTQDVEKEKVLEAVDAVLRDLISMKEQEGASIASEFLSRLQLLQMLMSSIQEKSTNVSMRIFEKLSKAVEKLNAISDPSDKKRIYEECALIAERRDISEEISRFFMHLDKCKKHIEESGSGKVMEFILQELLRETNTIGSKTDDGEIAHQIIAIKSEIEKLREQVQNVE